jgi:Tol biopolymer transport system component
MIVPPDGKDVTRLPTKAKRMFWLQVSPNGKQLAYTAVVNGKFKGYVTDLFSEPSLISKVARLADIPEGDSLDGEVDYCRWSADGKKLACFEGLGMQGFPRGKAATTWIVDIKTGEKADFNLPNGHFLQDWSPDGNWFLTFKQDKSTENEFIPRVYLVKRDSSEVRRLSSDNQLAWSARFSPDGRRALFVSLGRQSQVHVVDLADGKPRPVSPELNAVVHSACWSPDGKRIAYAWQQRRVNPEDDQTEYVLSVIDQDGKNPATLRTDKGRDGPPVHVDWR